MPRKDYEEFDEEDLQEEDDLEHDAVEDEDDWEEEVETDEDVADIFNEAQDLDYGRGDLTRKLRSHTDKSPALSGGDIDADWENADVGEEAVGGQNPTPDQSDVDELGEAMGVVYQDDEPVDTDDKLAKRDKNPWELNPASTGREFNARVKEEFEQPLRSTAGNAQRKRTGANARAEQGSRAAVGRETHATTSGRGSKSNRVATGSGRASKRKHAGTSSRPAETATHGKSTRAAGHRATGGRRAGKHT